MELPHRLSAGVLLCSRSPQLMNDRFPVPVLPTGFHSSFQQFEWLFGCLHHVLSFLHKSSQWSLTGVQVSHHQITDCKCWGRKKRNIFGQVVGGNYEYNDTSVITVSEGDFEHLDPFYRCFFNYRSWLRIAVPRSLICKMKVFIICCFHLCLFPEILFWFDVTTAEHISLSSAQKEWAKSCCKGQHCWWKAKYSCSTFDKCHSLVCHSSLWDCAQLSSSFSLNFCSLKCKHCIFVSW